MEEKNEPFIDLNKVPFGNLVESLENKWLYQSTAEAYTIMKLIDSYKSDNKINQQFKVINCHECPFLTSHYDGEACGYDTVERCGLATFLKLKDSLIDVYDSFDDSDSELEDEIREDEEPRNEDIQYKPIKSWCPLKNGSIKITL